MSATGWPAAPPIPAGWVEEAHWKHYLVIRYEVHEYHVDFKARTGCDQPDGTFLYNCMTNNTSDVTEDFDKGERLVDGSIKWDGCSHMYFGPDGDNGYIHMCGVDSFNQLTFALKQMMRIASTVMPKFDASCAGLDKLAP